MTAKQNKIIAAAGALVLSTSLAAGAANAQVTDCSASGSKQEKGAIVGALAGGLLGNSISGHNRTTGTVIGALGGAAAGSAIGCSMQKKDERQAETYYGQRYGANYDRTYTRGGYRLAGNVQPASFRRVDQRFVATTGVNLRAAPTTRSSRVGGLMGGEAVNILASAGRDWYLVGDQNNVGVGYVHADFVRPAGQRYASYY